MIETMLRVFGIGFVTLSAILTLPIALGLTISGFDSEGVWKEALGVVFLAAIGATLLKFSRLGIRKQLQIDSLEGEIRVGFLDARRQFNERARFRQSDIQSAFLLRNKAPSRPTRLALRVEGAQQPLAVFKCSEAELIPVLNEITVLANKTSNSGLRRRATERRRQVAFG